MADPAPSKVPPNGPIKRFRALKKLEDDNPNDNAFSLITEYNVPVQDAMTKCGATVTFQAMFRRVDRFNERMAAAAANAVIVMASNFDQAQEGSTSSILSPSHYEDVCRNARKSQR